MGSAERDRCVLLSGLMGSGKSRVGRALALELGWDFVDTDVEIERVAGLSVAEIFAREGEPAFRARERDALRALPTQRCVVALGGGAVVSAENRAILAAKGRLLWLDAEPETLVERMGEARDRPLLAGLDRAGRVAKLTALRAERGAAYAEAELRVATDGCTIAQAVSRVREALHGAQGCANAVDKKRVGGAK
ncbi:MAG TPA: shikimate kinase [Myxococcota bacterium]|nr:shikimate kinase [Myxococcota bacterium]